MEARASEAAEAGNKLVYVGLVDVAAGKCTVSLQVHTRPRFLTLFIVHEVKPLQVAEGGFAAVVQSYPADHAFAQLSGSDNIIAFTTRRYSQQPLMIRCGIPHFPCDTVPVFMAKENAVNSAQLSSWCMFR